MKYKPLKGLVVAAMLASSLVLAAPQALVRNRLSLPSRAMPSKKSPRIRLMSLSAQPVPTPMPSRPGPRIIWP